MEILKKEGFEIVNWGEPADISLINTCTITNVADKKSRNAISRARSINEDAKIIVCGCMAQRDAKKLLKLPNVKAVIGTDKRTLIAEIAKDCYKGNFKLCSADSVVGYEPLMITCPSGRTRAYIKVQEGCSNYCSYCIIPYVRGIPRSRPVKDAVSEAKALTESGARELVITGVNLTSYSDNSDSFTDLICELSKSVPDVRIRLGSLDVYNLKREDLKRLSELNNLCPHFHISLQSGSDGVLKRMHRKYNTAQFSEYTETIKEFWDNPAITTDIITGFPQESESEFEETADFIKKAGFARLHVFPYSEREGTAAAAMQGAVPKNIRKERAKRLIEIGKICEQNYIDSNITKNAEILFEEKTNIGVKGHTERYIEAVCDEGKPGELMRVRLIKRKGNTAFAKPTDK